jgi:uncharacterized protein YkwD
LPKLRIRIGRIAGHGRPIPALLAGIVAILFTLSTPGLVRGWDDYAFSGAQEDLMLQLVNQARASAGLPALKFDADLRGVARWRSKDMYDRDYLSHDIPNPPGGKVFDELHRQGICYEMAGENIGVNNYPDDVATQTMFNGWMSSSGHRALILGTGFKRVGIGAFKGTGSEYPKHYWTLVAIKPCSGGGDPPPTPKPTPKPPKPTPKPTPKPPKPTPKPTAAAPQPTPEATREPAATLEATPAPTAAPPGQPTIGEGNPAIRFLLADGLGDPASWPAGPFGSPPGTAVSLGLQVVEPPPSAGLLDTIVGTVVSGYLGS